MKKKISHQMAFFCEIFNKRTTKMGYFRLFFEKTGLELGLGEQGGA